LGISNIRHRSACRSLRIPANGGLAKAVFETIARNYASGASANKNRSRENWRWPDINADIAGHNNNPETVLEKAIAVACLKSGRNDWANQIPVASGLMHPSSDRRCAIDLVHQRSVGHFEFIELKVGSDTPLYAAIELIRYVSAWLLARGDRPIRSGALLDAHRIDCRVLAPANYYKGLDVGELGQFLHRELDQLGLEHGAALTFAFDTLPVALNVTSLPSGGALLALLQERTPLLALPAEDQDEFLPGIPLDHVRQRLIAAAGNELVSGKFRNPNSSAALAANTFGWFLARPSLLPPLPGIEELGSAEQVEIEFCVRFPWKGGTHPHLDAAVTTSAALIGVESKRFEPFRDKKRVSFSPAYDRPVWGNCMTRYGALRLALEAHEVTFRYLDAAQLIKHAYGLVTEARRQGKEPVLFYLFAEPEELDGQRITPDDHRSHRDEIAAFAAAINGDEVLFRAASYRAWLAMWTANPELADHGRALLERFSP
jgi:hypothetical protein